MSVKQYVDLRTTVLKTMHQKKHLVSILRKEIDTLRKEVLAWKKKTKLHQHECSDDIARLMDTIESYERLGLEKETLEHNVEQLKAEIRRLVDIRHELLRN
tara:strand:+ start:510 stop:812 length:303 start_codon:yes stop_codon:yes gene_type:complete